MGSSLGEKIGSAYGVTLVPVLLQLTIAVLVFLQLINYCSASVLTTNYCCDVCKEFSYSQS